jgi:hypothetical protein
MYIKMFYVNNITYYNLVGGLEQAAGPKPPPRGAAGAAERGLFRLAL